MFLFLKSYVVRCGLPVRYGTLCYNYLVLLDRHLLVSVPPLPPKME